MEKLKLSGCVAEAAIKTNETTVTIRTADGKRFLEVTLWDGLDV